MAMRGVDRILTIVVTATVTSAAWIVLGSAYVDLDGPGGAESAVKEAELAAEPAILATPSPRPSATMSPVTSIPTRQEATRLAIPVMNVSADDLVDSYSDERSDEERLHEAIDIMAPEGTSVLAAAPGTVERLYRSEAGGNAIYVRSTDGRMIYYYAHLEEYSPGLKEGQRIRRSQRIGTVGSTGNADAESPHLHFAILATRPEAEWWEPSTALNPYPLLRTGL